jgi:hypothetical protein
VLPPAARLLDSRVKSNRELQTVREMVGSKNSEWGATRIWHGRTPHDKGIDNRARQLSIPKAR